MFFFSFTVNYALMHFEVFVEFRKYTLYMDKE